MMTLRMSRACRYGHGGQIGERNCTGMANDLYATAARLQATGVATAASISRSLRRKTFPLLVFGRSATNWKTRGTL